MGILVLCYGECTRVQVVIRYKSFILPGTAAINDATFVMTTLSNFLEFKCKELCHSFKCCQAARCEFLHPFRFTNTRGNTTIIFVNSTLQYSTVLGNT